MVSALKLVLFFAFYGAVKSSEPVIVHEFDPAVVEDEALLQLQEDLELQVKEAIENGDIELRVKEAVEAEEN